MTEQYESGRLHLKLLPPPPHTHTPLFIKKSFPRIPLFFSFLLFLNLLTQLERKQTTGSGEGVVRNKVHSRDDMGLIHYLPENYQSYHI